MNRKNLNGSFNITVNGLPYNTIQGDKYYNETVALFNSNPELFEIEKEKEISIEELRYNKKQELKRKRDEYKKTILIKEYVYLSDLEVATNNYENMKNCLYGWVEQDYLKYREEMNKIVNKYNEIKQLISQANTKEELDNIKIIF